MENTLVFIDAGFLSKLSKHFGDGKYLIYDLIEFPKCISKKQNLFCEKTFYYTAPPFISDKPSEKEIKKKKDYDNFIAKLSKNKDFIIREGRCQRLKIDGQFNYKQKGVDSLAVIDLVNSIIDYPQIKKIILIASDTDFVPIIKDLQENYKIKVILVYFTDKRRKSAFSLSNHLWNICKDKILIKKEYFY